MLNLLARVNAAGADDAAASGRGPARSVEEEEIEDLRAQVSALREALAQEDRDALQDALAAKNKIADEQFKELQALRARNAILEGGHALPSAIEPAARPGGEDGWDLDFEVESSLPEPQDPKTCPAAETGEAPRLRAALDASEERLRATQSELSSAKAAAAGALLEAERQLAEEQHKTSEAETNQFKVQNSQASEAWSVESASLRSTLANVEEQLRTSQAEVGRLNGASAKLAEAQSEIVRLHAKSANVEKSLPCDIIHQNPSGGGDGWGLDFDMDGEQQGNGGSDSRAQDCGSEEVMRLREVVASLEEKMRAAQVEGSKPLEEVVDGWGVDLDMDIGKDDCQARALENRRGEVGQLQDALARSEKQMAASQESTQSSEERLRMAEIELTRLRAEHSDAGKVQSEVCGLRTALSNTEDQMRAYQAEVLRMKGNEGKLMKAEAEAARVQGALEGTQGQMQAYQAEVIRLKTEESKVVHLQAEVTRLQDSTRIAEDQLGASQHALQRLKEADAGLALARNEAERLQGLSAGAEEKLQSAAAETAQLRSETCRLQSELANAEQQASSKQQASEMEMRRMAQDLRDVEQSCKDLQVKAASSKRQSELESEPSRAVDGAAGDGMHSGWDVHLDADEGAATALPGLLEDSAESLRTELALAVGRAAFAERALSAERAVNDEGVVAVLQRELASLKAALLTERRAMPSQAADLPDMR